MKTLDEVIMCLENCGHIDCDDCPYHYEDEKIEVDDCAQAYKDALQWLKGYKADIELDRLRDKYGGTSQKLRNTSQITCPKCHSEFVILPEANNPLTWDELRTMEGKPVWVEIGNGSKGWVIIRKITDSGLVSGSDGFIGIDTAYGMDTTWQAYRKERG